MELTPDVIFALIQSDKQFPVDFDDAIRWWDSRTKYGKPTRRDNLIRNLKADYLEGFDYWLLKNEESRRGKGSEPDKYFLTVECFKMMGMQVSGKRGREIRQYFLSCEAELKRCLEREKQQVQEESRKRLIAALVSDDIVSRRPKFTNEFYELLYQKRGNGWENRDPSKSRPSCVGTWTNQTIYNNMAGGPGPGGVKDKLNEVNPRIDGRRKDKHHWHLKELGEFHLNSQLEVVKAIARISPDGNWDKFLRNVAKACPNGEALQLSLLDYLEELESKQIVGGAEI